jgi:ryanodine receptor 2
MRQSAAALALIEQPGNPPRWLVQWNERWQAYSLVGGHRHDGESFADCVRRETAEELRLAEGSQFRVGPYPAARLNYRDYSHSAHEETEYRFELFVVELLEDAALRVASDPANRWVSRAEISAGRAADGRKIADQVRRSFDALDKADFDARPRANAARPDTQRQIRNPKSEILVMSYVPKPIDTTRVALPVEIDLLTEQLAENTHDLWAAQRIAQGWTFGPNRDDANQKHPCLIPYADLPDSEKIYDRQAAIETLKAILALGYRIEQP